MPSIRLHPSDREKYGAHDAINIDFQAIGLRQRAAVEKASKRSLRWMYDQLAGVPEIDEAGNPVPVTDKETGELVLVDGQPVPKLAVDPEAVAMLVWMGLWGAGIKVPWDGFDVVENGLQIERLGDEDDEDDEAGKAEEPETGSTTTP